MTPHELDALIHEVLDGTAAPADCQRLESWLAAHPEARDRHERLAETLATLRLVPNAESPPGLRDSIVGALGAGTTGAVAPAARELAPIGPRRVRRPLLEFALPFAAGLAAGVLILAGWMGGLSPRHANRNDVTGSMVPPGSTKDWHLTLGAAQIEPRLWSRPGSSSVRLRVRNAKSLVLEVRYESRARRVARVQADLAAAGTWDLGAGRLRWQPATNDELTIEFADLGADSPVQLVMESADGRREEFLTLAPHGAPR